MSRLLLFVFSLLPVLSNAQELPFPAVPNHIYSYADKQTAPLEIREATHAYEGADSIYMVPSGTSPVLVKKSAKLQFLLQFEDGHSREATRIYIFKLTIEKDRRFLEDSKTAILEGENTPGMKRIRFHTLTWKEKGLFIEIPDLEPGQYAFVLSSNPKKFQLFGVQP